jgi:hypothetical protein
MPYRTTRRTAEARQRQIAAMARGREAARLARPAWSTTSSAAEARSTHWPSSAAKARRAAPSH